MEPVETFEYPKWIFTDPADASTGALVKDAEEEAALFDESDERDAETTRVKRKYTRKAS